MIDFTSRRRGYRDFTKILFSTVPAVPVREINGRLEFGAAQTLASNSASNHLSVEPVELQAIVTVQEMQILLTKLYGCELTSSSR